MPDALALLLQQLLGLLCEEEGVFLSAWSLASRRQTSSANVHHVQLGATLFDRSTAALAAMDASGEPSVARRMLFNVTFICPPLV